MHIVPAQKRFATWKHSPRKCVTFDFDYNLPEMSQHIVRGFPRSTGTSLGEKMAGGEYRAEK